MKIPRMVIDYTILFFVPAGLAYVFLKDHKEETADMLVRRPDVLRQKKQEAQIMNLLRTTATTQDDPVVQELLKKGSSS